MSINKNNIYNIIKVSDLAKAEAIKKIFFFGYNPEKPIEEQSVQIPFSLFQDIFDTKQNNLVAGTLVELKANTDGTVTISVLSDDSKQNKLVNTDGTIVLKDNTNGTTDIKAVFTDGVQNDNVGGTKTLQISSKIISITSSSQINYIGFESDLNAVKFVNNSNLQVLFSFNIDSAGTNKILKDYEINTLILNKSGSIEFFKTASGWRIVSLFGVSFFPDITQTEEASVIVNSDGTAKSEDIKSFVDTDETAGANLTTAELDGKFPRSVSGFQLICPNAGVVYVKVSDLAGWVKYATTKV